MMPTAEPMPNERTATTSLVASDSMPSAVVALAPSSGASRCATVFERLLPVGVPPLLVPVLHDVHVVGNREDDDERHDHAGEDVVGEAEQRIEAERPEHADADASSVSTVFRHDRNMT